MSAEAHQEMAPAGAGAHIEVSVEALWGSKREEALAGAHQDPVLRLEEAQAGVRQELCLGKVFPQAQLRPLVAGAIIAVIQEAQAQSRNPVAGAIGAATQEAQAQYVGAAQARLRHPVAGAIGAAIQEAQVQFVGEAQAQ